MAKSALSHRERVKLALEHKVTDRVPISMVCSAVNDPVGFEKYLQKERGISMDVYFKPIIDVIEIFPRYIGPPLKEMEDFWSVIRKEVSYGPGAYEEIDYYPLAGAKTIDDVEAYRWPTTDWFDYTSIPEQIKKLNAEAGEEYCIMVKGGNIFETSWYMRGFEQAFMDIVLAPEVIGLIMEKVTQFYIAQTKKVLEAADGMVDLMFTADDVGCQKGLLMSLDMYQTSLKPYHKRLHDAVHEYGAKGIYHTDGAVMEAVGDLMDMGVDVLQALQFDARDMDPQVLKDKYGDRLCFEGGVSVQKTMPFGTAEDVRQETLSHISVLGKSGGYICGPSHQIQFGTPPENIVALFDTAMTAPMTS